MLNRLAIVLEKQIVAHLIQRVILRFLQYALLPTGHE